MPLFFSAWVTVSASKARLVTEKVHMNSVPLYSTYEAQFQKKFNLIFEQSLQSSQSSWCNFLHSSVLRVIKLQWYLLARLELLNFFWFGCYRTLKSFHCLECRVGTFTGNSNLQPNIYTYDGNFNS